LSEQKKKAQEKSITNNFKTLKSLRLIFTVIFVLAVSEALARDIYLAADHEVK